LLFAYFNNENRDQCATLPQLLFGYLDKALRPARIQVVSAGNGVVHMPQIGYFKTGVKNAQLDLVYKNDAFHFEQGGENVHYTFEPPLMVADGKIEVYRYNHPLFKSYYIPYDLWMKDLPPVEVEVENTVKHHLPSLKKALVILKQYCPPLYDEI